MDRNSRNLGNDKGESAVTNLELHVVEEIQRIVVCTDGQHGCGVGIEFGLRKLKIAKGCLKKESLK